MTAKVTSYASTQTFLTVLTASHTLFSCNSLRGILVMTMLTAYVSEWCNTLAEQLRSLKHKKIITIKKKFCTVIVRLNAQILLKIFTPSASRALSSRTYGLCGLFMKLVCTCTNARLVQG